MSRLTVDITEQQHQALKAMAALQGKTIKEYVLERLLPAQSEEEQALAELRILLEQRLTASAGNKTSKRSITEIAEEAIRVHGAA
jgi:transposase